MVNGVDEMKADEKHTDSADNVQHSHTTLNSFGNRNSMDGDDLIMRRFGIIMRKVFATLLRDDCGLIIGAGDGADRFDGLPVDNGDELNFISDIAAQKIAAQVPL